MKSFLVIAATLWGMASTVHAAGWEKLPPLPEPNAGFVCGVLGDKIVVMGGTNWRDGIKHWLDAIWTLDIPTMKWQGQGRLPHPLAYTVTSRITNGLLVAGGSDGMQPRKEIWLLTPSLERVPVGKLRDAVALALGGVVNNGLIMLGGCTDVAKLDGMRKGGQQFDLGSKQLSPLPPAGDLPSGLGAMAVAGNELFVFGGANFDPLIKVRNLNGAWAWNTGKSEWRALKPCPIAVRGAAAVTLDDQHVLIAGGCGGEPEHFLAETYVYDVRRDSYTRSLDLPLAVVGGFVMHGGYVYCLGGEDVQKHRTDACWRVRVGELLGR